MLGSTVETAQTAAVAAAAANAETAANAELFAKEFETKLAESGAASARDKIAQTVEKLTAALPGITLTNRSLSTFSEVGAYYAGTGTDSGVNITSDMMEQMGEDEALFNAIRDMIAGLLEAGSNQSLVNAGGASSTGNVNITANEIRYVEVQRNGAKTTLSVSSLALDAERAKAESIQTLLALLGGGDASGQSRGWSFANLVSASASWEFEALLNDASTANQVLQAGQSFSASIEVVLEQWGASGGGIDIFSYMQIMGLSDPIVLDLGDEGINLTSAEDGVYFDIKGDGSPVRTAFITGNNAFLYLDQNGNNVADSVHELFGDQGGHANGFENLRQYDDNGDGVIDANDAAFDQLRLWRDLNRDGVNQAEESLTLAEAGVASIDLGYAKDYRLDSHGNVIGETSSFTRVDGSLGLAADVWLRSRT